MPELFPRSYLEFVFPQLTLDALDYSDLWVNDFIECGFWDKDSATFENIDGSALPPNC